MTITNKDIEQFILDLMEIADKYPRFIKEVQISIPAMQAYVDLDTPRSHTVKDKDWFYVVTPNKLGFYVSTIEGEPKHD